jgi:hypothetical protein
VESGSTKSQVESRIVTCAPHDLRPHPSYSRHGLTVPVRKLLALKQRGALAFAEPLAITRNRTIIDGYARWELAKETGRTSLSCIEYELSDAEALQWFLERHAPSTGLNAFTRIMLSLDLEPSFLDKARSNKQLGGRHKGWSNLTKAEEIHVRSKVAQVAGVSVGNVTKVKQLKGSCALEYIEALYRREISIHWAWKRRNAAPEDQLDALGRFRFQKGLLGEIRQRASLQRKSRLSTPQHAGDVLSRLNDFPNDELASIRVTILRSPGHEIFITQGLAEMIGVDQSRLWDQKASCNNSRQLPDPSGTEMIHGRLSATT